MDLRLAATGVVVGCSAFAAAFVACGRAPERAVRGQQRTDPLDELVRRVRSVPAVRDLEGRANAGRRRAECLRQMPVMLDVVTLGLSAGLSFDSALELYCKRYANELSRALSQAMLAWRLGTSSRDEALGQAARRVGISSLDRFASVVSQALSFGSPLAATLERQAQAIREEQRAQMEEEIERVPVRMLIPLGTLIVPAMLLAILGPLLGSSLALG